MNEHTLPPDELTRRISTVLPTPPGQRMLHRRSVTVIGHFRAEPEAHQLSSGSLFSGEQVAVIARFSGTRAGTHDADSGDQGLAVRFVPATAEPTDLIAFTLPVFFVRTGADMLEFLTAVSAAPQCPAAMQEFRQAHPESSAAFEAGSGRAPGSYVGQRYHSVHAFGLVSPAGTTTWARLEWHPENTVEPLPVETATTLAPDYLSHDMVDRLPARMTLYARLPSADDPVHDPTAVWAEPARLIPLGRMTLQTRTADSDLDFDPLRLAAGMSAPRDRLAADRSAIYHAARISRHAAPSPAAAHPDSSTTPTSNEGQ